MSTTGANQDAGASSRKSRSKSTIYRVTGLPCLPSEDEVESFLRKAIVHELQEEEQLDEDALAVKMKNMKKISIILPPDSSTNGSVALVDWKAGDYPNFMSAINEDPSKSWEIDFEESQISFDRHFLGFTQLYTTKAEMPITADIIALTGLDGHAYGSFKGRGTLGTMWLRDFLSKDLPSCRTMIYGYDSKLSSYGINTIMDYGRGFLEAIKKVRKSKEELRRPLFFVTHSFGGIIVAHSICKASMINDNEDEAIASLYKATYGLLLFGTPHKGLAVENIRKMLLGNNQHPRQALLDAIDEKSYSLMSQLSDFKNVLRGRKIVSFFEQAQTRGLVRDKNSSSGFSRTGDYATAVETDSALLQLPDTMEVKVPLQLDHSQLVKYDSKISEGYTSALYYLLEFERDAPTVVAARFLSKQASLQPSSTIPYDKDPHFVGREDILQKVERKLSSNTSHARLALVGLGGMGKSQIAIEFSHRLREKFQDTLVLWVYANTVARFQKSYRDIADALELDGRNDSKVDILQLVSEWLKDERNGRWLLIVDNADDAWMFSPPKTQVGTRKRKRGAEITASDDSEAETRKNLLAYIPTSRSGAVLVTSRNKDAAHRIAGNHIDDLIEVHKMAEGEAIQLLKAKLPKNESLDGSQDLLAELDNIPLAITQAAAYITRGSPRMNVPKYLALFKANYKLRTSLLDEDVGDLRRDPEVPNAVIRTLQISFDQIRRESQPAADLFSFMSVLNRQGIPESLLLRKINDRLALEDSLKVLLGFSLITSEIGGELFDMHRLVQLATRRWLTDHDMLDKFNQDGLKLLWRAFPYGEYENWNECALLLPHVEAILECNFEEDNLLQKAKILHKLSWYLRERGEYQLAKLNVEEAIKIQEFYLGENDIDLGLSYNQYGVILEDLGRHEDAEAMHRKDLKISKEVNGERHPDTLSSINNLGSVLGKQGRYEEAESLHRQALRLQREVQGEQHLDTLHSMNNLGIVLKNRGMYEEAEVIYRDLINLDEVVLRSKHPRRLTILHNFAFLLQKIKKYDEASVYYQKVCIGRQEVLGNEHPSTKNCLNSYADMVRDMDDIEENKLLYQREVLQLYEEIFGPEHPQTLQNLALDLGKRKEYIEASNLFQKALLGYQKVFGNEHPDTKECLYDYTAMVRDIDDTDNRLLYQREVLQLHEEILGLDDPETLVAVYNLALDLGKRGEYIESSDLFQKALLRHQKVLGKEHPDTQIFLQGYAAMVRDIDDTDNRLLYQREVLRLREEILGLDDPKTFVAVHNLALDLEEGKEYIEASKLFQRAYLGKLKVLGKDSSQTINTKECYSGMLDEITDPETKSRVQRQYDETMESTP